MLQAIENSSYGTLPYNKGLKIDRIILREKGSTLLQLRITNITNEPIVINSFIVADFILTRVFERALEHGWLQCSEVGYKTPEESTLESKLFLQRDQNHLSFKKEYGYIDGSIISEWFTVIKMYGDELFIGAVTTANQFAQIYVKKEGELTRVRVTCQYDGLTLNPREDVYSEKIFFEVGETQKLKVDFANSLAKNMGVEKVAPAIRGMCNSYYWHENIISEDLINKELGALETLPEKLNLDYFQLDAGYTKYFGDWLNFEERFPSGFEPIINRIKKLGYKPGIWLSPFAVNPGTKLHDCHPSWFLKGIDHGHFDGRLTSPFDNISNITDLEVLDPTNEKVLEYVKQVLTYFKNLGFELFKIDFIYPICLTGNFSKAMTRAQAIRFGLEFIRKVLGDDIKILTGITQLSPIVGIADFVRTGIDTLNPFVCGIPGINRYVNEFMLEKDIRECTERMFLNGIVWRADPDVLVFREGTGINTKTIIEDKKFAKENDMSLWIGDSVYKMDLETRSSMVKFFNTD